MQLIAIEPMSSNICFTWLVEAVKASGIKALNGSEDTVYSKNKIVPNFEYIFRLVFIKMHLQLWLYEESDYNVVNDQYWYKFELTSLALSSVKFSCSLVVGGFKTQRYS